MRTIKYVPELVPPPPPPAPPPPTEPPMPDLAIDPVVVAERATSVGTHDPKATASRNLQREARAKLDWLMTWRPEEAAAIVQEQFRIQDLALKNTARLATVADAGRELEAEILRAAEHRLKLVGVKGQLDHAKSTLASPQALDLPDGALIRLKLQTEHLPATITEIEAKITESASKIESLVKASGCDRAAFLAQMLSERTSHAAHLHSQGVLTL